MNTVYLFPKEQDLLQNLQSHTMFKTEQYQDIIAPVLKIAAKHFGNKALKDPGIKYEISLVVSEALEKEESLIPIRKNKPAK